MTGPMKMWSYGRAPIGNTPDGQSGLITNSSHIERPISLKGHRGSSTEANIESLEKPPYVPLSVIKGSGDGATARWKRTGWVFAPPPTPPPPSPPSAPLLHVCQ